ncbi:hypothetical protein BCR33DRAFT_713251, partial [Rhizoclosmatium globosum]
HERLVRLEEQYVCLSAKLESAQREKQMWAPQSEPGRLPTTVLNQTTFQIQQSPEPNQPQQNQFNRLDGLSSTHSFRLRTTSALTERHSDRDSAWSPVQPQHKHKYEGFHSRSEDHKSLSAVHQDSRRSPSPQHHSNSYRNRSLSPRSRSPVQLPPSKYICRTYNEDEICRLKCNDRHVCVVCGEEHRVIHCDDDARAEIFCVKWCVFLRSEM